MHRSIRMLRSFRHGVLGLVAVLLLVVLACGGDATSTPQPTATSTPQPTATSTPQPTATPTPEAMGIRGGVLTITSPYSHNNWNALDSIGLEAIFLNQVQNLLVEFDPTTPEPLDMRGDLASSWDLSSDSTSYTFHINPDANWHDGTPVTAADVKWSLDAMVDPDPDGGRPRTGLIKPYYKSSTVINDKTIQVDMKFASPAFISYLGNNYMIILNKNRFENLDADGRALEENILGSGPFKLTNWEPNTLVEYERNTDYWKPGLPYLDGLRYIMIADEGTDTAAYQTQQGLMTHHAEPIIKIENVKRLAADNDFLVAHFGGPMSNVSLYVNHDEEPFGDPNVRRAIHLALHRQAYIQILTGGEGKLGWPFPPGFSFSIPDSEVEKLPGYRELNGEKHPDDLAEARRLLAQAGYPDGNGFPADNILARALGETPLTAQILQDQLNTFLGIETNIDVIEFQVVFEMTAAGDYQFLPQSSGVIIQEPEDTFRRLYSEGAEDNITGPTGWKNARLQEISLAQGQEPDPVARRQLILEAADIILEENPSFLLMWISRPIMLNTKVKGFNMHVAWYNHQHKNEHLWCDPTC